jgi:hypothetical protein
MDEVIGGRYKDRHIQARSEEKMAMRREGSGGIGSI